MINKLAFLMKKKRCDNGWKQDYVAIKLHISKSYYSELERGVVAIQDSLQQEISVFYNIEEITKDECKELKENLVHCFLKLYKCDRSASDDYGKIIRYHTKYTNSILCLEYWLLVFIYSVTKCEKPKFKIELKKYESYLSNMEKDFYKLYQCIQCRNEYNDLVALNIAEELLLKKNDNVYFVSILNYHAAFLYYGQGDYLNAYKCIINAKDLFRKTFNISRYFIALNHEAMIYTKTGKFQEAEEINRKLVHDARGNVLDIDYNSIINNSSLNMIMSLQYERSLYYLNLRTDCWCLIQPIYFNYAWTLYKLDKREQVLKFVKDNYNEINDKFIKRLLNIIKLLIIDENAQELLVALKETEKFMSKTSVDYEGQLFIYHQLLNFYKRKNYMTQQIKYLHKILEINKNM